MRTTKELLQLMLDDYDDKYRGFGLCDFNSDLFGGKEEILVDNYIQRNRPMFYQKYFSWKQIFSAYYWKPSEKIIRKKWLKYHINKLK